jgi:hypothetical protein
MVIQFNVSPSQLPGFLWNKLSNDSQRYVQLLWKRDAREFVGLKNGSGDAQLLGLKDPNEKNFMETIGDLMLFPMVDIPHKLSIQNSHVAVAVAASAGTMFFLKFFAQPFATTSLVGRTIAFLPYFAKLLAKLSIVGLVCRSVGRMFNTNLMRQFYAPVKQG